MGRMKPSLVALFVVLQLLCDLALPYTGAFRFDPHASIDGFRAEEIAAEALDRVLDPASRPEPATLPAPRIRRQPADARRPRSVPRPVTLVPRRDGSAGDAPAPSPDDH